jgi:predicted acetyltransferase
VLERLWQLYRHDLSEFRDMQPDEHGLFKANRLTLFLDDDPDRRAYLLERDGLPVGFALVDGIAGDRRHMVEFFVTRSMRGRGVAREAARLLFELHPGTWEIGFQEENPAAARFWRRVAGTGASERRVPVPDKPHIPDDVILTVTV